MDAIKESPRAIAASIPGDKLSQQEISLLPPDHPFLQKFQQILKQYLLQAKAKLETDIVGLKQKIDNNQEKRQEAGLKLSNSLQIIRKQQDQLKEYAAEINISAQKRQQEEGAVAKLKIENDEKSKLIKEYKALYQKRLAELEHSQQLIYNLTKWKEEVDNEVKTAHCVVRRDAQNQKKISEESKRNDLLLFNLDMEVQKREKKLAIILKEITDMGYCTDVLKESISNANTDLEVLQNDHKRLTAAWTEVIFAISVRDKMLLQLKDSMDKVKNAAMSSDFEIQAIKKAIFQESRQSEKLDGLKLHIADALNVLKAECRKQTGRLNKVDKDIEALPKLLEETELQSKAANKEGHQLESELRSIQRKHDQKNKKKYEMEECLMKAAQNNLVSDLASGSRLRALNCAQKQRRILDLTLANTQKQLAETLLQLETLKSLNFSQKQRNAKLNEELELKESNLNDLKMEIKSIDNQINRKTMLIDKLSVKLGNLTSASTESAGFNELEMKIKQCEKAVQLAEQQVREQQEFCIILQNHCVKLTKKRSMQHSEFQVTQKQLSIVKQKTFLVDVNMEKAEQTKMELNCEKNKLLAKTEILSKKIFEKRQQHGEQESECELEHSDLLQKLKDNEMKVLSMEEDIIELQADIENLKDLVLNKHREALSWEAKCKLTDENVRYRKDLKAKDSDNNILKTEIRKMQLRYENLKCNQQKLMKDMEQCVTHFEHIENVVDLQRHTEAQPNYAKSNLTTQKRKVIDLGKKTNKIRQNIKILRYHDLIERQNENKLIVEVVNRVQNEVFQREEDNKVILDETAKSIMLKQYNLAQILSKQNRAKMYKRLANANLKLPKLRPKAFLAQEMQDQKELATKMMKLTLGLVKEFPANKQILLTLHQSLQN